MYKGAIQLYYDMLDACIKNKMENTVVTCWRVLNENENYDGDGNDNDPMDIHGLRSQK